MARFAHAGTRRLLQLTGDYDPEGRPHFNMTGAWGVEGVDLGANTRHLGKQFIFFGDVPLTQPGHTWPPQDADFIAFIDDIDFPPGAALAAERQLDNQLDVFFVASDGALCVAWVQDGGIWQGPVRITPPNMAPPGAAVAAARQSDDQLDVFFVGNDGSLYVTWVVDGGVWQGPVGIPPAHLAPPGAKLAAARQLDDQLDVFVIGNDGSLFVYWVIDGGTWQGPVGIPPARLAPPGASIAAARQLPNQLDVFVFGNDGSLFVYWVVDGGIWQGPVGIPPAHRAPPGAGLAAARQRDDQLDVFVIGSDGSLYVYWVIGGGTWQGPVGIPPAHVAPPGASIAAARQGDSQLDVFAIGADGSLFVYWVVDGGTWQGPVGIPPAHAAPAGAGLCAAEQLENQLDVFTIGNDRGLDVYWVIGGGTWQGPVRTLPAPFRLTPILKAGLFFPFSFRAAARVVMPLTNETPSGAFSYDGRLYVFVVTGGRTPVATLTSSADPFRAEPYKFHFELSDAIVPGSGLFFQIAPYVVRNAEIRGLPSEDGDGLIMFGHAGLGVRLAWMPLRVVEEPCRSHVRFYTGDPAEPWSPVETKAKTLFATRFGWTSLSVGRIPGRGDWILLNQKAGGIDDNIAHDTWNEPIVARIAAKPWDIASAEEIPIFDPRRDGARGKYMASPPTPANPAWPPRIPHPSFAYGAYILDPYTEWDAGARAATIRYLLSTGSPYQVQVMETQIRLLSD
jgi:hypothetical protein